MKNNLEVLLDKIEYKTTKVQVMNTLGDSIKVDWKNPIKYESSCAEFKLTVKNSTFPHEYYLNFCYGKFNWWNKYEK